MKFEELRTALTQKLGEMNALLLSDSGWKRSHYIIIEELINDNLKKSSLMTEAKRRSLGTTISHMTLKRFFELRYDDRTSQDLRFLKTMEKLCIFLGHPDFSAFFTVLGAKRSLTQPTDFRTEDDQFFIDIIKDFISADFKSYTPEFSDIKITFGPFLFEDGPYLTRLIESRKLMSVKKISLEGHRSSYELVSAKVVKRTEDTCICETQEYWNMVYVSKATGERFIYNQNNTQMYFFQKRDGIWKIWNNFNPDAGKFVKEVELNSFL